MLLLLALLLMALLRRKVTIEATAGPNGAITPVGKVKVKRGADQSFRMGAGLSHSIKDVNVDGKSIGMPASYTFKDVRANHKIHVTFEAN